MITKEGFFRWLKDNDAYNQYIKNIITFRGTNFSSFLKTMNCYNYIVLAFRWHETPEHIKFWHNLNVKWQQYIDQI